jgi:hypothetical protein
MLDSSPTKSKKYDDGSEFSFPLQIQDTASILEVPNVKPGTYRLRLSVPKTSWLYTRSFETCLAFDFSLDYTEINNESEGDSIIHILSVMPKR